MIATSRATKNPKQQGWGDKRDAILWICTRKVKEKSTQKHTYSKQNFDLNLTIF